MTYEQGYDMGYQAKRAGCECAFLCKDSPSRVTDRKNRTVDARDLDFARGYIDGWMRAADDMHD